MPILTNLMVIKDLSYKIYCLNNSLGELKENVKGSKKQNETVRQIANEVISLLSRILDSHKINSSDFPINSFLSVVAIPTLSLEEKFKKIVSGGGFDRYIGESSTKIAVKNVISKLESFDYTLGGLNLARHGII